MIAYLEGRVIKQESDRIVLLSGSVGYEILLPEVVMNAFKSRINEEKVSLFIYHYQTERQPKPTLIGFNQEIERDFFHRFITVEAIGPLKAVHALSIPVRDIAIAIENKDVKRLSKLKGIGNRTSQKIVATLHGKMKKFALMHQSDRETGPLEAVNASMDEIKLQVLNVLVNQLGHRQIEADEMIEKALTRSKNINTAEDLFEEVYRGEMES
jgi:Holliday junction DNA helicase RuvA